jgi:SAM-dependent methyltransferase
LSECRNCGSGELTDLGPIGKVYPFFLKRALGIELRVPRSRSALKQKVRDLVAIPMSLLSRVASQSAFVDMEVCEHCSFIQTAIPFSDEEIARLYADYRSPSYHQQRILYEPEYAAIAEKVGSDPVEVRTRTTALLEFLRKELKMPSPLTILDYGGADGRFIPDIPGSKFVYEISNIDPSPGVSRIKLESDLGTYSLVLLAHVTEHVTHPLNLVRKLSAYVEPGGHLYIETPQEISDHQRAELQQSGLPADVGIHEHINYYCVPALAALLEAAGFTIVAIESAPVDLGWIKGTHLRALGRKPLSV